MPPKKKKNTEEEDFQIAEWLDLVVRQEIRSFLEELWDEGDLKEVFADAIREGASEAIEEVATKQPWTRLLGDAKLR